MSNPASGTSVPPPPRLVVLCGTTRSGKSTIAEFLRRELGFARICSDDIREEYGMVWGQPDARERVINHVVRGRAIERLMMGVDVVIDTTAMFRRQRALFFDLRSFALGQIMELRVERYLLSLNVSEETWEARQLAAGRSLDQRNFYREKFESVDATEVAGLTAHLVFDNNTEEELETIQQQLKTLLERQSP